MDYTSDSDISEITRDQVSQGLASVKRKRFNTASQVERICGIFVSFVAYTTFKCRCENLTVAFSGVCVAP